jgi:hypothetical protein
MLAVHTYVLILLIQSLRQLHLNMKHVSMRVLLVGYLMPERSRVITQTKMDTLALQVGGWS